MSFPRTIQVQVAFNNGPGETAPTWETLTGVKEIRIRRGRTGSTLQQSEAGTCTIVLDNSTRKYDPFNTSSPSYGTGTRVSPAKRMRVRFEISAPNAAGTFFDQFTGHVLGWFPESPERPGSSVRLECVDPLGFLNTIKQPNIIRPLETSDARINAILSSVAWPSGAGWRNIPAGNNLQATTYTNTTVLAILQEIADIEGGLLYAASDGSITLKGADYRRLVTEQALLTFGPTEASNQIPFSTLTMRHDLRDVRNDVTVTRTGGTPQNVFNSDSVSVFFRRTYGYQAGFASDADALARAQDIAYRYGEAWRAMDTIAIDAHVVGANATTNTYLYRNETTITDPGISLGQRVRVIGTPTTGAGLSWYGFIEGLEHTIDAQSMTWKVKATMSPWGFYGGWILGDAFASILGQTTILTL